MGQRRASDGYLARCLTVEGACNLTWKVLHVTAVLLCCGPTARSVSEANKNRISFDLIYASGLSCQFHLQKCSIYTAGPTLLLHPCQLSDTISQI